MAYTIAPNGTDPWDELWEFTRGTEQPDFDTMDDEDDM